jgi:hypothetical protein
MDPVTLLHEIINPALKELELHGIKPSDKARKMLLTIAQKEAGPDLEARYQYGGGPARGLWQFERIAVLDVMTRPNTTAFVAYALGDRKLPYTYDVRAGMNHQTVITVHEALAQDDRLAAVFARLNLWNHKAPLPELHDEEGAFQQYLAVWRPGAWSNGASWQRDKIRQAWGIAWDRSGRAMDAEGPMA